MANQYRFEDIVDLIGPPVEAWPRKILETYMKPSYKSADRFKLCIFNFINGFDNNLFLEFALGKGALRDEEAIKNIKKLPRY